MLFLKNVSHGSNDQENITDSKIFEDLVKILDLKC